MNLARALGRFAMKLKALIAMGALFVLSHLPDYFDMHEGSEIIFHLADAGVFKALQEAALLMLVVGMVDMLHRVSMAELHMGSGKAFGMDPDIRAVIIRGRYAFRGCIVIAVAVLMYV